MVELAFEATIARPEVGAVYVPNQFASNRGKPGPPAWMWRDHLGAARWETGTPPAKPGVVCDAEWRPIHADDLPLMQPPIGGFMRKQGLRQKNATKAAKVSDLSKIPED